MKVTLQDGSEFDLAQDLAQHGIQVVGPKGRTWYNWFKNKEDQVLRVKDQEGKEHDLDAYAYLANKGAQVDADATWKKQQEGLAAEKEKFERDEIEQQRKELESAGLGEYLQQSVFPFSSNLVDSGKLDPDSPASLRAGVTGVADVLSFVPRGLFGLYDQARYSLSDGKKGAPIGVSMSKVPEYGAEKVKDPVTGEERSETLGEHWDGFKEAVKVDPWGVVKDIARESARDPLQALSLLVAGATDGAAAPVAAAKTAPLLASIASKYKKIAQASGATKAADMVRKINGKLEKAGAAGFLAKHALGGGLEGGAQGVIMKWAMGDEPTWNDFVIEGIEEGAFDLAISSLGKGAAAAWKGMSRKQKADYLNRVRTYAKGNVLMIEGVPQMEGLPAPDRVPLMLPPGSEATAVDITGETSGLEAPDVIYAGGGPLKLPPATKQLEPPDRVFAGPPGYEQTPDVIAPPVRRPGPSLPPVMEAEAQTPLNETRALPRPGAVPPIEVIPNAPGVTLINGAPVSIDEELPAGVSRREALMKRVDPAFKPVAEKEAAKEQAKLRDRARADIKALTAAVLKVGKLAEDEVQKAFKETLAESEAETKAAADKSAKDLQALQKAVSAIIDPTVPTSFEAWNMTLGAAHETLEEKRKAFEEFHIREAKQAKAIKEKITPPKAPEGGGPAPKPTVAPDALLEAPQKPVAPRFNPDRGNDLAAAIKAKLAAQGEAGGGKSAAPAGPKVEKGKVAPSALGEGGAPATAATAPKKPAPRPAGVKKTSRERAGEKAARKPIQVFDETRLDDLLAKLDKKLGNRLSANPGWDPELMTLAIEIGGIYVQKGVNSFIDWADKMRSTVGEKIGPFVNSIWEAIQNHPQDRPFDPELVGQLMEFAGIAMERDLEPSREALAFHFKREFGEDALAYVDSVWEALEAYPEGVTDDQTTLPVGDGSPRVGEEGSPAPSSGRGPQEGDRGESGRGKPRRGSNRRNPSEPADLAGGDGPVTPADEAQSIKLTGSVSKNIDLTHKAPVELTPAKRREANAAAVEVLERVWSAPATMTEADRDVMRRYTGLGGIEVSKTDASEQDDHGVRYQHYTSYQVVKACWRLLEALGFNTNKRGLTALEPAAGIGNFIGLAPRQIKWYANEVDDRSSRIMTLLYPANARNTRGAFEAFVGPKVDLVVTNVPFLRDRGRFAYLEKNTAYQSIGNLHNYFIMKSVDHLKDNGIGLFITSTGTMDAKTGAGFRRELNQKAEVVTALRLPEGAFKKNASYEGTVDLIVLRKRTAGELAETTDARLQPEFVDTVEIKVKLPYGPEVGKEVPANRSAWYEKHPELVMGTWVVGHGKGVTQSGVALEMKEGGDFEVALDAKFKELMDHPKVRAAYRAAEGALDEAADKRYGDSAGEAAPGTPVNGLEVKGGKVYRRAPDGLLYPFRPAKPEKGEYAIPDSAFALLTEIFELTDELYAGIQAGRDLSFVQEEIRVRMDRWREQGYKKQPKAEIGGKLQMLLPGVTKKVGKDELQFRDLALEAWVDQDLRYWRLRSLYNSNLTGLGRIVSDQVRVAPPPKVDRGDMSKGKDVVAYIMAKFGVFREDLARSEFKGKDFQAAMSEVESLNWDGERFLHDNEFLVGNLWPKIDAAEAAGRTKELAKLRKALPEQKTWQNVEAAPQATWWSPEALSRFARSAGLDLGMGQFLGRIEDAEGKKRFRIGTLGRAGEFVNGDSTVKHYFTLPNFVDIVLNQEVAHREVKDAEGNTKTIADAKLTQEIRKEWKQKFEAWARTEGRAAAEEAAKTFNRSFAGNAVQDYSQEKIFIDGLASTINGKPFTPYPHQFAANRMAMNLFGGLLAWGVGYGKTRGAILQYAQLRAAGKIKKALFAVPGKTMFMWRDNFYEAMPGIRVKVIRGDQESTRIPDCQDAAVNEYDIIIVSHDALPKIPLKAAEKYIAADIKLHRERIRKLEQEKAGGKADKDQRARDALVKKINDKVDRLVNKLKGIEEGTRDPRIVNIEMWDVDAIFADEAHAYKNYFDLLHEYADKQFLNTGRDSDVGNDFQYKTRFVHERNGRGGVFLLTATPTPNKPIEIYKMMKLIAPWELEQRGLHTMDDFVRDFLEIGYATTTGINGVGGEVREMVLSYRNLHALRDMVKSYVDIRLLPSEEVKKLRPNEVREHVKVTMSDAQMFGMAKVVTLSTLKPDAMREIGYDPLTLTSEARMLAVDPARVYPRLLKEEPDFTKRAPKLGAVMQKVGERFKKYGRLQLVFLDEFKIRDVMPMLNEAGEKIPWPAGLGRFKGANGDYRFARWILNMEDQENAKRLLTKINGRVDEENWPIKKADGSTFIPETSAELADFRPIFDENGEIYVGRREVVEDLHNRMAEYAVEKLGFPASAVAVVNGEKNAKPLEKRAIEEKVDRRELKLIIGNRKALGEGMNLQTEGDAIHQVDVPWNPMPLIQAEGRFVRARADGNDKHPVTILYYGCIGSLDAKMYEVVDQKKKWQDDLWVGDADTISNELDNLEDNGFDPDAMKKSLQVDNGYVAGYQTYSQIQEAKRLNAGAIKARADLEGDLARARKQEAHHAEMVENARERINARIESYNEDLKKWQEKAKVNPEAKKPEEPTHGRDQEIIERNTSEAADVAKRAAKLEERLRAFSKVSWEAELVQVADRMIQDVRENKFKSVGVKLAQDKKESEQAFYGMKPEDPGKDQAAAKIKDAEAKAASWGNFLKRAMPDIYAKFAHLADMVATKALKNHLETSDLDGAEKKVQEYSKKFYGQAGRLDPRAAKALGAIAAAGALLPFLGPDAVGALAGAGVAAVFGWKRLARTQAAQRLTWSVAARLRQVPGFELMEPKFNRAYAEAKVLYSRDQYALGRSLEGLDEDDRLQVAAKVENPALPVSPEVEKAAALWRRMADKVARAAGTVGFNFGPDPLYYPRVLDWDKVQAMDTDMGLLGANIDHLVRTLGISQAEAGGLLLNFFDNTEEMRRGRAQEKKAALIDAIARRHPNIGAKGLINQYLRMKQAYGEQINGNLRYQRRAPKLLDEMYRRDPLEVLPRYVENAWKTITYRRVFGVGNQLIESWLDANWPRFGEEKNAKREEVEDFIDTELYRHRFKSLLSDNQETALKASRGLQSFHVRTKLFTSLLAPVKNLAYGLNMSAVAGPGATLQGVAKVLEQTVKGQPFKLAQIAGAISDRVMQDAYGLAMGKTESMPGKVYDKTLGAAFTWSEKFVRSFAFHAGQARAERLFRQGMAGDRAALKELEDVVGAPRLAQDLAAGRLSTAAAEVFGLSLSEDIAGSTRPFKLTRWMNTPEGQVLWQFRRMAFAQTVTLKDKIILPAMRGNVGPLLQWGASVGMTAWVVSLLASALRGGDDDKKKKEPGPIWAFLEFVTHVNALGLIGDMAGGLDSGNDWSETPLVGTMAGPTLGTALHTAKDLLWDVLRNGESLEKQAKQTIQREIPLLNRLSKWEIGAFDWLEIEPEKKGLGGLRGL